MTGKKEKTISGAMYSAPNLEHNLRTHIPPNSVEERRDREIKKGHGKRFPPTYYEKIGRINRSIFAMRLSGR